MSETRDRIIATTSVLLTQQGYHATGLNQIVRESGTPRGSLYHYFPQGKEELAAEAVRHRGAQMKAHVAHELAAIDDPADAIVALIATMVTNLRRRNFASGAPIAAVAMEASSASESLRLACEEVYLGVREPIEDALVRHGLDPDAARRHATAILAALEGGLVLSYTMLDPAPLEAVGEMVEVMLTDVQP